MSVNTSLNVVVCQSPDDAINQGYDHTKNPLMKSINVDKVVVVTNGTTQGNSTVDFMLTDPSTGQQFVFMVTSNLLKSLPS